MAKRQASAPNNSRKRKKGNATYAMTSLDPTDEDKRVAEDIHVWNISTSETTGRVRASRTTHKHYYQVAPSLPGGSSMNKKPGEEDAEVSGFEDTGILADSEPSEVVDKQHPKPKRKRTRVRVIKENDSVSRPSFLRSQRSLVFPDEDGTVASELSSRSGRANPSRWLGRRVGRSRTMPRLLCSPSAVQM